MTSSWFLCQGMLLMIFSWRILKERLGSWVWAVALLKNKKQKAKKSQKTRVCCLHVASRPLIGPKPTLSGLVTSLSLSPTPNLKSIDIKLWLWRRFEVLCVSTTTANSINTTKPCRAACDGNSYLGVRPNPNVLLSPAGTAVHSKALRTALLWQNWILTPHNFKTPEILTMKLAHLINSSRQQTWKV